MFCNSLYFVHSIHCITVTCVHNDDIHTYDDVIKVFRDVGGMEKTKAEEYTKEVDTLGCMPVHSFNLSAGGTEKKAHSAYVNQDQS